MSRKSVLVLLCASLLVTVAGAGAQEARRFGTWGVDLSSRDLSIRPGDNFFRYVNGNWLKTVTIPADRASIGGFVELQILSEQRGSAPLSTICASGRLPSSMPRSASCEISTIPSWTPPPSRPRG